MKKREETSLRPTKSLLERLIGSFGRILSIVRKELFVILCDKGSRAILIAPVFIQAVLFGYAATFNLERVPWCVYDESRSALSIAVTTPKQNPELLSISTSSMARMV